MDQINTLTLQPAHLANNVKRQNGKTSAQLAPQTFSEPGTKGRFGKVIAHSFLRLNAQASLGTARLSILRVR